MIELSQDAVRGGLGSHSIFFTKDDHRSVLNELIRPADPDQGRVDPGIGEMFRHCSSIATRKGVVLQRAENFHTTGKELKGCHIKRLDPSGIDDRGLDSLFFE